MKSGARTTEFWTTLFMHVLSVVTVILSATGSAFDTSKLNALVPVAAMIASGIAQSSYSHSRGKVKSAPTPNTETTADPGPVTDTVAPVAAVTDTAPVGDLVPPFNA